MVGSGGVSSFMVNDKVKVMFEKRIGPYNMDDLAFDGQYKDAVIIELKQETW